MRVVGVVQARMGSTRLPGKVLESIGDRTMLAWVVRRLQHAIELDRVVVATTSNTCDDAIAAECHALNVAVFRGSEHDVLARYQTAAHGSGAGAVVRVTADCPLIDAAVVDRVVRTFLRSAADYASNTLVRTYPRGLDVEVFTTAALDRAAREARAPEEREHVTPYFYRHPELFKLASVESTVDLSGYRWTVDTKEDLQLARAIYARLPEGETSDLQHVLRVLAREPSLTAINAHVVQKVVEVTR
jgi:spore coat polysaccharide biosynthesis protein SpsF